MLFHTRGVRNEQKFGSSTGHGWPMVHPMDRGQPVTAASSFSLGCVAKINRSSL